ncbi:hypothetical protein Gorai_002659 [Gossypium raimondii]|uniref:DUF4283 domain-containing protein n=1 Tax=Gossypium raimondii TaxID=29730 RepID=A0A7J8QLM6_GOSRA|nr:hypothetical protein [Gossypium raimondii]
MKDELANMHLADEEEDAFQEDPKETDHHLQFCLVGTCLTNSFVHFLSLQNTMADLWHPIGGIAIIDLGLSDDPLTINLNYVVFWIQIHDLPPCLMSEQWLGDLGLSWANF